MSDIDLRIDGYVYSGWKDIRITKSMEQFAHTFQVRATDRWDDDGASVAPIPIEAGNFFKLDSNNKRLITGFIVANEGSESAQSRSLGFTGISKTGDLIDCSADYRTGEWKNESVLTIAKNLCDPFGIEVSSNISLGRLRKFAIEPGETVFNCLSRAARRRSALLLTNGDGNVVFDRVSSTRINTVIERGVNVKQSTYKNSWASRFSEYTLKAQTSGSDDLFGKSTSKKRTTTDDTVSRHRPLIILADNESDGAELVKRAKWERNTRAGKSKRLSYTVHGWQHDGGFWAPNTLVHVKDAANRVDDTLLIVTVTFLKGNTGTTTQLELTLPEAYGIEPLPKASGKPWSL